MDIGLVVSGHDMDTSSADVIVTMESAIDTTMDTTDNQVECIR